MDTNAKTKVVHCKQSSFDVYIGRGSRFGNKWSHKQGTTAEFLVATRTEAIACHKAWLLTQPQILIEVRAMKGKILGCWCKHVANPLDCHGDTFAEIADMPEGDFQKLLDIACKQAGCSKESLNWTMDPSLPPGRKRFQDLEL